MVANRGSWSGQSERVIFKPVLIDGRWTSLDRRRRGGESKRACAYAVPRRRAPLTRTV